MSDDLVKRARAALEGVTEGPWIDYEFSADHWVAFESDDSGPAMRIGSWHDQREANARFIAASRELVPAMADRIEELETKLAEAADIVWNVLSDYIEKQPTDGITAENTFSDTLKTEQRKFIVGLRVARLKARATLAELTGERR